MKIQHLFSDPLKISSFKTVDEFITFAKIIALENDDTDFNIQTKQEAEN